MSTVPLLIAGEWAGASGAGTLALVNPATEEVIGSVARATVRVNFITSVPTLQLQVQNGRAARWDCRRRA